MKNVSKEYTMLFNAITDIETELEAIRKKLIAIQQAAEEMYISDEDHAQIIPVNN